MLVRSQLFRVHQVIGNPMATIKRFSDWNVDELVLLDISKDDFHDLRRSDLFARYDGASFIQLLEAASKMCFMPLAVGGRIRSLEDIRLRLSAGADKCIINTAAVENPHFIYDAAHQFGAQCVVLSMDVLRHSDGTLEVYSHSGAHATGMDPAHWAQQAQELGAGEIFLTAIHRDGAGSGYDLDLIQHVRAAVNIPVVACGGVGSYDHFAPALLEAGASGAAAANIFHFFENSYPFAKKACVDQGANLRPVRLNSPWLEREPHYAPEDFTRIDERHAQATAPAKEDIPSFSHDKVRWCTRCLYPDISAAPMAFDEEGVCMGCRMSEVKAGITDAEWARRKELLREILMRYRCRDGSRHDCVIAVSGGKDSWYQTWVITQEFGLNPLLVTYNGNNYTEAGWRNLWRMREVFHVDHIVHSPSVRTLQKLNKLAMITMGDMNWHAHVGITTVPVRVAAQQGIPLVIWGEHGYLDLCGQFSMNDFPEMSYRDRLEHFARGFEWNYFVGMEGLSAQDMASYQYPSDQTLFDFDIRGIYIGNYLNWEANNHIHHMQELGFEINPTAFDRTYRRMSNLDDMHENGVHDYMKYIKFGYGRCTDHVCKDIRAGLLTRAQGVELVQQYDHVKPRDLQRWLEYTGWSEDYFDRIADTFRDRRVWRKEKGQWIKDNPWI